MPERRKLLTAGELAAVLGVSSRTVSGWVRSGRLVPSEVTMGGHARFDLADVRRQIDEQRQRDDES